MKNLSIFFFLLLFATKLTGQETEMISGLNIGDKVPDVLLKSVFNYKQDQERLYNFKKGELLLIDFFGTWCASCITAFPKMEELQKKFDYKITVLPVTTESRQILAAFAKKNHIMKVTPFPVVTDDTLLNTYFSHEYVPHVAWVDADGIVQATTSDLQVTEENIRKFFANNTASIMQKKDMAGYNWSKFLPTGDSNFIFRSVLTKKLAVDGVSQTGKPPGNEAKIKRLTILNQSILNLYMLAFNKGRNFTMPKNTLVLNVRDSSEYLPPDKFPTTKYGDLWEWMEFNAYCYELIVPEDFTDEQFYSAMFEDLNRYLKAEGKIVKRKVPCWIITTRDSSYSRFKTEGNAEKRSFKNAFLEKLQNVPMEELMSLLNQDKKDLPPIINATGFSGNIDMEFSNLSVRGNLLDITCLKENLSRYGLAIQLQDWETDVLEITD